MELLTFLYMSTAFIGLFSYVTQIMKLATDETKSESVSIVSWAVWSYTSCVAFFYACYINGDMLLMMTGGLNFGGCLIVTGLLLFNRFAKEEGRSITQSIREFFTVEASHDVVSDQVIE